MRVQLTNKMKKKFLKKGINYNFKFPKSTNMGKMMIESWTVKKDG